MVRLAANAAANCLCACVQPFVAVRKRAAPALVSRSSLLRRSRLPFSTVIRPSLQRQDVPPERRPVHDEIRGKGVDCHRPQPPQSGEYRKLRRARPTKRQKLMCRAAWRAARQLHSSGPNKVSVDIVDPLILTSVQLPLSARSCAYFNRPRVAIAIRSRAQRGERAPR